ncbi:MAG: cation diffusion facilitator family transporter [bacterium]
MSSGTQDNNITNGKLAIKNKDFSKDNVYSKKAVWKALGANLGIAAIKLVCWYISKSSAMLSESIHSATDGFNSVCLLVGLERCSRPADRFHPFGYGLEANIWALFASLLMLMGTGVSLFYGFDHLINGNEHLAGLIYKNYIIIAITLLGSIAFEIWAVTSASIAVLEEANIEYKNSIDAVIQSFSHITSIKSPTTKFVWFEDTAALVGVLAAFVALTIAKFLPPAFVYIPDAIASIFIGLILLSLALYLLTHNVNALTGASAKPQTEEMIRTIANSVNGISQVHDLKTMDMGPSGLIVNMEIEVDPETQVKDADDIADKLEQRIRAKIDNIAHVTIEVQADETEEDWEEKFQKLIEEGKAKGVLKSRESKMLSNFFDFTNTVAWESMIPRIDVDFISSDASINDLIDLIIDSGHTRIPVYKENIDNIIGVVNAKDLLKAMKDKNKEEIKIEELTREITIVPENKPVSDMLNDFIRNKSQISAVVDEHGGVAGIITMEDVLEEIVGEIWDEYDVQVDEIIKIDENSISVFSKMNIYDLNERFNLDLPTEDFQTIGGYIFGLVGREPEIGDEVEASGLTMKVENMDGHKITRVILYKADGFQDVQALEEEEG